MEEYLQVGKRYCFYFLFGGASEGKEARVLGREGSQREGYLQAWECEIEQFILNISLQA